MDITYSSKDRLNVEKLVERFEGSIDKAKEEDIQSKGVEFTSSFSISKIQEMDIDEYVIGKPDPDTGLSRKSTFCYHLEIGLLSDFGGIFENKLVKEATISELIRALLTFSISDFKYNNIANVRVLLGALD